MSKQQDVKKTPTKANNSIVDVMDEVVEMKFPRGEREWCIQCAKRIRLFIKKHKTKTGGRE